jgi:hypothetical protein
MQDLVPFRLEALSNVCPASPLIGITGVWHVADSVFALVVPYSESALWEATTRLLPNTQNLLRTWMNRQELLMPFDCFENRMALEFRLSKLFLSTGIITKIAETTRTKNRDSK